MQAAVSWYPTFPSEPRSCNTRTPAHAATCSCVDLHARKHATFSSPPDCCGLCVLLTGRCLCPPPRWHGVSTCPPTPSSSRALRCVLQAYVLMHVWCVRFHVCSIISRDTALALQVLRPSDSCFGGTMHLLGTSVFVRSFGVHANAYICQGAEHVCTYVAQGIRELDRYAHVSRAPMCITTLTQCIPWACSPVCARLSTKHAPCLS